MAYKYRLDDIQKEIWKDLCIKHRLTMDQVTEIYSGWAKFVKYNIENLELKDIRDESQFEGMKTNFNIPGLAKLYANKKQIVKLNNRFKDFNKVK